MYYLFDDVSKRPLHRSYHVWEYSSVSTNPRFPRARGSTRSPRSFPTFETHILKFNVTFFSAYTLPSMYVRKANPRINVAAARPVKDTNPNPEVTMVTRM